MNYFVKRTIVSLLTLLIISFLLFSLIRIVPGNPFNTKNMTAEQIELKREELGLNDPVITQYARYMGKVLQGDFGTGTALYSGAPIKSVIGVCISNSFRIGGLSVLLGVGLGLLLGILAALHKGGFADKLCSAISVLGVCVPSYVFMIYLRRILSFKLRLLPVFFDEGIFFTSSLLPAISMSVFSLATVSRFTRNEMVEVLDSDFVLLVESKGVYGPAMIMRHVLRNSLIPIITVIGPLVVGLLCGACVIEKIYGINGIGRLMVEAISGESIDYNYVLLLGMLYSTLYIVMMFVLDILYGIVDPRVSVKK